MAHAGGAAPAAKRLRRAPAIGFETYGPGNPNQPAFIDFSLLSEPTIRRYLEKYDVPVKSGMTLAELRVQASRHFTLAPISDLANPKGLAAGGANGSSSSSSSSSANASNSSSASKSSSAAKSKSKSAVNGATTSNAIDRFHGFLVKLKMRAKNVKRREKEHANQLLLKAPLVPAAIAATVGKESVGSGEGSDLAAVPSGLTNRDPKEGYCVLSCKFSGSSKSGGTMIACDGKDHPEQWYHLSCVGLDDEPNGQWFCFACKHAKMQEEEAEKQRSSAAAGASANSSQKSGKKLQTFVKYIKAALKTLGSKKGRSAEGTAKQITAVIERKFGDKLDTNPESDSRKTPVWKAFVAKALRSTKAPFQKAKKNGQWVYSLVTSNSKSSTINSSASNSGGSGSGDSK